MKIAIPVLIDATGVQTGSEAGPGPLHPLAGRPLAGYGLAAAQSVSTSAPVLVVTGDALDEAGPVAETLGEDVVLVSLPPGEGLAHVLAWVREAGLQVVDRLLVVRGDLPLLTGSTLRRLVEGGRECPGRLAALAGAGGELARPVAACCAPAGGWVEWAAGGFPAGAEAFSLPEALFVLGTERGLPVVTVPVDDPGELRRVDSYLALAEAGRVLYQRTNEHWMRAGVTIVDPAATYVEPEVVIGPGTTVWPNTHLRGRTTVGRDCQIGPNTIVDRCQIGDRCRVLASVVEQAVMEEDADIGPFGHLRKGARVCRGAHMGNFGELKNATLGPGAHMGHFSYVGDADVGARANVGAGTITCNYDGTRKHRTSIGEDAFIGSGTMLVAPVEVGEAARVGAGAVVTRDVPDGALAYGVPARVRTRRDEDDGSDGNHGIES